MGRCSLPVIGVVPYPFALPELVEGRVPEHLPDATLREPVIEAGAGAVLVRVPTVARYLVRADEPVRFQPAQGATHADVRCFHEGPVVAAAAVLRGLLPLRAAAVAIDGRAVAIAGPALAGKSALAAALAARGHAVLADAVAVASTGGSPGAAPVVAPLAPDPVLWPDTAGDLRLDPRAGRLVRPALPKRAFRLGPEPAPAPLAAVVVLRADVLCSAPAVEALEGVEKPGPLLRAAWHRRLTGALGLSAVRFAAFADIAGAAACFRLTRPIAGASPSELAARLEELVR